MNTNFVDNFYFDLNLDFINSQEFNNFFISSNYQEHLNFQWVQITHFIIRKYYYLKAYMNFFFKLNLINKNDSFT